MITDQSYERNINVYQSKDTYRNVEKTILENDKKLVAGNKEETIAGKLITAVST